MRRFVLMSGIAADEYDELKENEDLELVYLGVYKEVIRIRTLPGLTERVWDHYDLHQLEGLKEIDLFRVALRNLYSNIRKLTYGRNKKQNKRDSESVCDQSERAGSDPSNCRNNF